MASAARGPYEQTAQWERWSFVSGILFALLQLAVLGFAFVFVVPTHAPLDAPATEAASAFARHALRIAVGNYLLTLPIPFLLLFLGGLFTALQHAEGRGSVPAITAVGAGVASAVIGPLGAIVSGLSARIAQLGGDPAVVKELDGLGPQAMAFDALPRAVLVGVVSAVVLRSQIAPRWIGWTGFAVGLVSVIATGTLVVTAMFPLVALEMLLFPLWVLALSVWLLGLARRPDRSVREAIPV